MIRRFRIQFAVFLIQIFSVSFFSFGAENELEDQMFMEIAEARKPLEAFFEKYEAALIRLEKTAQAEGKLEGIIEIRAESKAFSQRDVLPETLASYPKLAALQKLFHTEKDQLSVVIFEKERAARLKYAEGLEDLVKQLTKENEIDAAVAMKAKAEAAKAQAIANAPRGVSNTGSDVIFDAETTSFTKEKNVRVQKEGDLISLQGGKFGSYIGSKKEFSVPFKIHGRAMTNSSNVRFFFNDYPIAVFNWEGDYTQMRLRHFATKKPFGAKGAGKVEINQMSDFEIDVTSGKVRILVNDELRFEYEGEFADLKGTVGIGPADGSTVTVESFSVEVPVN